MKKLLVVVDYQNDFVDGALGFKKAEVLEAGIYKKIKSYLDNGNKVLFTYDTHNDNYLETREGKNLPVVHCIDGTKGHELYGRLVEFKNNENTLHYKKAGFGLSPKDVIDLVKEVGEDVDYIEIVGVVTNICVLSNAVVLQSQYYNADIVVDASLCASFDDVMHKKTLDLLKGIHIKVINE